MKQAVITIEEMSRPKNVKIRSGYLFDEAVYYRDLYNKTGDQIAYGRYCELRDIMLELNLSQDYINYRFGKECGIECQLIGGKL